MLLWTVATISCWAFAAQAHTPPTLLDKFSLKRGVNALRGGHTTDPQTSPSRSKRTAEHLITECFYMTTEEGQFYHRAGAVNRTACGVYIVAEPDQRVEMHFNYLEVPCENGGLISYLDGWELNGEFFPSTADHGLPMSSRFAEFCGQRKIKEIFRSSQNAAMIMYRMPGRGSSFSFTVKFVKNPTPCNMLFQSIEDVFTLRNYGRRSNCSILTLFPAAVKVMSLSVGVVPSTGRGVEIETGTIHKVRFQCHKRGLDDYVQIGGSPGLDNSQLQLADAVCGINSKSSNRAELIGCETTSVRLVSSGAFDNSVTVAIRRLTDEDFSSYMSLYCLPEEILE